MSLCGMLKQCLSSFHSLAPAVVQVLRRYLDLEGLLKARLVCRTWHNVFSAQVQQLRLIQPELAKAAQALGRQAAAAFSNASILQIDLADFNTPEVVVALLRPLRQLRSLQELRVLFSSFDCRCLPAALPLLPQLQVLDLTGCFHRSCDLLVIAQHMKQLQQLLLHCPEFVTLSGRVVAHHQYSEWDRIGGIVRYRPQHVAALAQLPRLRVLECTVPTVCTPEHRVNCEYCFELHSKTMLSSAHQLPRSVCPAVTGV
jgi:hypothetical protein